MRTALAFLRRRPLVVRSPLPQPALVDAMSRSTASTAKLLRGSFSFGLAARTVAGEVSEDHVRLVAMRPGVYNAWRPAFEGRVLAADSGSVICGTLGSSRFVAIVTIAWFGFAAVIGAIGCIAVIGTAVSGHLTSALHGIEVVAGCLGVMGLGAALVAGAIVWARRDELYLLAWLNDVAVGTITRSPD